LKSNDLTMPRQRKSFNRKSQEIDGRTFFIIATEGKKTEMQYFEGLKPISAPNIFMELLEKGTTASAPADVIKELDRYAEEYILAEGDELWMVIDRDSKTWTIKTIKEIAQKCVQKKYHFALSNPCFEIWLLLHVKDINQCSEAEKLKMFENKRVSKVKSSRKYLEKELLDILGSYNKTNLDTSKFIPHINLAISQAKALDVNPTTRWVNDTLGTRVYLLVEKLM